MTSINNDLECCAINEIVNLSGRKSSKQAMWDICDRLIDRDYGEPYINSLPAFLMFSGENNRDYCKNFARFIKENDLGVVTQSVARRNPNTGNSIRIWIWALYRKNVYNWFMKNK